MTPPSEHDTHNEQAAVVARLITGRVRSVTELEQVLHESRNYWRERAGRTDDAMERERFLGKGEGCNWALSYIHEARGALCQAPTPGQGPGAADAHNADLRSCGYCRGQISWHPIRSRWVGVIGGENSYWACRQNMVPGAHVPAKQIEATSAGRDEADTRPWAAREMRAQVTAVAQGVIGGSLDARKGSLAEQIADAVLAVLWP